MSGSEPTSIGVGFVVLGAAVGVAVSFVLRTRIPAPVVLLLLAAAGAAIGGGGILLQRDPSGLQAMLAIGALAVLVPVHSRVVFGPFGRPRASRGKTGTASQTGR